MRDTSVTAGIFFVLGAVFFVSAFALGAGPISTLNCSESSKELVRVICVILCGVSLYTAHWLDRRFNRTS